MTVIADDTRPSGNRRFRDEIAFYLALRAGDRDTVSRMIRSTPELVNTEQNWESSLAYDRVLPFANAATPLITAIELGDLGMQELLVSKGADVNAHCGCATGESPLWSAVLLGRLDHARHLLIHGADLEAVSAAGNRPLHVAAMRGQRDMVELLLAHGAQPDALDTGSDTVAKWSPADRKAETPRRAADWARANGHDAIADLLMVETGSSKPELKVARSRSSDAIVWTGIRALDLFAPLVRGGLVRMPFAAGVGMVVLLGELSKRFHVEGGTVMWTGFTQPPFDLADWQADMAEFGLLDQVRARLVSFREPADTRREAFESGLVEAERLRDAGEDVLAIILSTQGFEHEIEASLLRLRENAGTGSITSIIMTPFKAEVDEWQKVPAPWTGQVSLDRSRAQRHLLPAIDPSCSLSTAFDNQQVDHAHVRLAGGARQLIADFEARSPSLELPAQGEPSFDEPAVRLIRYLCQPFHTTSPFTGRTGEETGLPALLTAISEIIDG